MKNIWRQDHIHKALLAVMAASLLFVVLLTYHHISYKLDIVAKAKTGVQSQTDAVIGDIEKKISGVGSSVDLIGKEYAKGVITDKDAGKRIAGIGDDYPQIDKVGLILKTSAGGAVQESAQVYERRDGKIRTARNETTSAIMDSDWYKSALSGRSGWAEPVFNEASKQYEAVYLLPVHRLAPDSELTGVAFAVMPLDWITSRMDALRLNKKDFAVIASKKGTVLYHPVKDLVFNRSNIFDLLDVNKAGSKAYERQKSMIQKAVNGERGEGYNTSRAGQTFWYIYRPIPSTGWAILVYFMKDAIPLNGKEIRREEVGIALALILFFVSIAALSLKVYDPKELNPHKLWRISVIFSVLAILTAVYTWGLTLSIPIDEYKQNKMVVDDQISMNKFYVTAAKSIKMNYDKEPVFIPTGIYLQSIEFASSSNIAISGYVWQRYPKKGFAGIDRGFTFPDAKSSTITEAYRVSSDKEETIGWYFEAVIRPTLDYSKYPFDRPNVSISIGKKDLSPTVILVPDLDGYKGTGSMTSLGIRQRISVPGYSILGTFFNYELRMNNATFGIAANKGEGRTPELFYTILVKRNFITPVVSKFFPILIVVSMLFIVIMSFSSDVAKQKNFGLTGFAVVGLIVSFFFSTLLTQIDLRQQFSADGIIFIENFNFITYLVLLLSAVQAFLFAAEKKIKFIQYEHCLIPKLLYWPIFTGLVLLVSLIYFY